MEYKERKEMMRPFISYDDVNITPVSYQSQKYDSKKQKTTELKQPIIKKGKTINIGDVNDLFELVRQLNHHVDDIESWEDYIEVSFKLKATY